MAQEYYDSGRPAESKIEQYHRLMTSLETERSSFINHWRDLADHILPQRIQLSMSDSNKGDKRNMKIVDSTPTLAARTLRAGMMAGITSPARPWKRLTVPDPDLAEYGPVKEWLFIVDQRMNTVFARSNLYNSLPYVYGDQGVFGIAAMAVLEDMKDVMRTHVMPIGSYSVAVNDRGLVDTFTRKIPMTVRQLVRMFVDMSEDPSKRFMNVSTTVRNLWNSNNLDAKVDVAQVITANVDYDYRLTRSKNKKYSSCYLECGSNEKKFLRESGYDNFPVLVPRWDVTGTDAYGTACPGMDSLGDVKALQLMQKRKAEAIEKMVRPPMQGPSNLRSSKASILPGDITYIDVREGQQKFAPVYLVDPKISELLNDIKEHQKRISRAFYEDLFMMLLMSDRREITAAEIAERHEEKLLMLGPTLERENDELLDPLVDRTFGIMVEAGMIPDAPEELQGVPLKVEYVSIMAQAQKMVGMSGLERFTGYVGSLYKVNPEILDKVDMDNAVDEYGDMTGVSPRIIRTDEQAGVIRATRREEARAAVQAEQLKGMTEAARNLAGADMSGDNALTRMTGSIKEKANGAQ